jgi:hypothetical protein
MAALAALTAPAFADAAIISNEYIYHQYDPGELHAMVEGQDFKVVVIGNPTVLPQEAFEAQLMKLLTKDLGNLDTRPTTRPTGGNHWGYRLVLLFNVGSGEAGQALCGDPASLAAPAASPGEITVSAALCRGRDPLTEAYARTAASPTSDGALRGLFSELTAVLFPNRPGLMFNRDYPN